MEQLRPRAAETLQTECKQRMNGDGAGVGSGGEVKRGRNKESNAGPEKKERKK